MSLYVDKKSEIQRELEAEDNAMTTICQAIVDHGGAVKWVGECLETKSFKTINDAYNLFDRMEQNFVNLENYELALYIKNEQDKIKLNEKFK